MREARVPRYAYYYERTIHKYRLNKKLLQVARVPRYAYYYERTIHKYRLNKKLLYKWLVHRKRRDITETLLKAA